MDHKITEQEFVDWAAVIQDAAEELSNLPTATLIETLEIAMGNGESRIHTVKRIRDQVGMGLVEAVMLSRLLDGPISHRKHLEETYARIQEPNNDHD